MPKICVVDASVVLKWFLPEPDSAAADCLLERFLNDEVELLAPDLILVETASALWKRVMIRKELSAEEAILIHRDLLTLPLSLIASGTIAEAAFQMALKHNHSPYDALYCALAFDRRCDFVTADRTLANKLQGTFPFIVHLSAIKPRP
jgi:predicted nucleic acid-binding protein